jgi:hypothetical protein
LVIADSKPIADERVVEIRGRETLCAMESIKIQAGRATSKMSDQGEQYAAFVEKELQAEIDRRAKVMTRATTSLTGSTGFVTLVTPEAWTEVFRWTKTTLQALR